MPGNVPIEISGIGNIPVVAAVAGKRIRVWSYLLTGDEGPETSIRWRSVLGGNPTDLSGPIAIDGRTVEAPQCDTPYFDTDIGADLCIAPSDTIFISGHVFVSLIG